jgi:autotransporter-associated beta strand protein
MMREWQDILVQMAAGACSGRASKTEKDWSFEASPPGGCAHTSDRCRRPRARLAFFQFNRLAVLTGGVALAVFLFAGQVKADVLAGWDVNGKMGDTALAASINAANLSIGNLTIGSGVTTPGTAGNTWGGNPWNDASESAAITANRYATFSVTASSGYSVSFSSISKLYYKRSSTGPPNGALQYKVGAGSFVDITTSISYSSSSSGNSLASIDLSGISALQYVSAGTTVTFRIVNWGGSGSTGTWYVNDGNSSGSDLEISGTVSSAAANEPTTQASGVSFANVQSGQMDVSWTSGNGAGRLVICRQGSPPSSGPVDGTTYTTDPNFGGTGSSLGGGKVVYAGTDSSFTLTGLAASTTYYLEVYEYNGGGSALNYLNSAATGNPNSQTTQNSRQSDIIRASAFTEPANIAYASYQAATGLTTGNSIEMARFTIRDGGATADSDSVGTTLSAITFNVTNGAALRRVALFDGSTEIAETAGGTTVTFSGLSGLAAADNGTKDFSVRATFNSTVTDNQQLQFTVGSATASAAGSTFAAANAGAAASSTSGDANRIEVTATRLAFTSVPSGVVAGHNFTATVQAQDANNNLDLDNSASVTITKTTGSGTLGGGAAQNLSGGTQTWASLRMDTVGAFTIQATAAGLTPATSGNITALTPNATAILFSATSTGSAWLTAGNWTGGAVPTGAQVAQFGLNPQSDGVVGINLSSPANQVAGAIEITNTRTRPLFIGDSSYYGGTLTLNGVEVNGTANVILRNGSASDATLQAALSGAMGVVLANATENKIIIDGTGDINIGCNITGSGKALTLDGSGSGALTLSGVNTYSGNTTISAGTLALSGGGSINNSPSIIVNGTLDVSGATGGVYSLAGGQTLKGNGGIKGTVLVANGATVSPGVSIGTLVFTNAPVFSGTAAMVVDKTGGTTTASRLVLTSGTLAFGGALTVTKTGTDALAVGDSFTLFAAGGFSGWFSVVSLPALASGLSWDTNNLATTGVLDVYPFATNAVQTMCACRNTAANLLIAKLLSKAASSRGAVVLSSAIASSAQGGAVSVNGDNLVYTPPADFTGCDAIWCVLQDGHGSIPAAVVVTVLDPGGLTGNGSNLAIRPDGGRVLILIAGTTNVTYQLQSSDTLSPANWQNLGPSFAMPAAGVTNIDDPAGGGQRYYRTILP